MAYKKKSVGQSMVEFSLVLPIILMVTLAIMDFGRALFTYIQTSYQVRSALRYGVIIGYDGASTPNYLDCDGMIDRASTVFFADSISVSVSYEKQDGSGTINCPTSGSVTADQLENGDQIHIVSASNIQLIMPFWSQAGGLPIRMEGYRTLVRDIEFDDENAPTGNAPSITISAPSDPASSDTTTPVTFTASAIDVEDGDISSNIVWISSLDGTLHTGNTFNLLMSPGTHIITAEITDSAGHVRADNLVLIVTGSVVTDDPPTVSIGNPIDGTSYTEGTLISFQGTANDTEDGSLDSSIVWTSSIDGNLGTGTPVNSSALTVGTHIITATVIDTATQSANDTITITINNAPNTPPVITISSPADASTYTQGDTVGFIASATDAEDGDLTASIAWTSSIDGAIGTGGSFSLTTLSPGTHSITATATDSAPASASDSVTITINAPANNAPLVNISGPVSGSSFLTGVTIAFTGSASDTEDGSLSGSITWTSSIDGTIGSGASFGTSLSEGTHTITASVTDSGGLSATYSITVTVAPPANTAPLISITGPATLTYTSGNNIQFTGTATDTQDGTISSNIVWSSDVDGTIGTGAIVSTSSLSENTHIVTATITDSGGLSASDTITIIVTAPAPPTVSSATLYVYVNSAGGSNTITVQRVLESWTEGGVTAKDAPAIGSLGYDFDNASGNAGSYMTWDVTALVQEWYEGTYINYGLALEGNNNVIIGFDSREGSNMPYIEAVVNGVTYTLPIVADTYLSGQNQNYNFGTSPTLQVYELPTDRKYRSSLLRFDLASLP